MRQLDQSSLIKLKQCEEVLWYVATEAIKESPHQFKITHGYRTIKEQKLLYAQGRTMPGIKVTNCDGIKNRSKHNYSPSRAFDIAIIKDLQITWDEKYYEEVGSHIMDVAKRLNAKIKWGKSFGDLPHFETI
jgi:peptidoglycan L-alanyl-D-glutamate endopeptidase CwlK